jgi:hypothetical protein
MRGLITTFVLCLFGNVGLAQDFCGMVRIEQVQTVQQDWTLMDVEVKPSFHFVSMTIEEEPADLFISQDYGQKPPVKPDQKPIPVSPPPPIQVPARQVQAPTQSCMQVVNTQYGQGSGPVYGFFANGVERRQSRRESRGGGLPVIRRVRGLFRGGC